MEDPNKIEVLTKNVKEYVNIQVEIAKLNATNKVSSAIAEIAFSFIATLTIMVLTIFAGLALGYYLSTLTGSIYSGFLIVTVFYILIALILYSNREKLIINPVRNKIIRQILSDEE
jgi:hypothetical protein